MPTTPGRPPPPSSSPTISGTGSRWSVPRYLGRGAAGSMPSQHASPADGPGSPKNRTCLQGGIEVRQSSGPVVRHVTHLRVRDPNYRVPVGPSSNQPSVPFGSPDLATPPMLTARELAC